MQRYTYRSLSWLEFDLLKPFSRVKQQFFLRNGGLSSGNFSGLNVGTQVGDSADHVQANLNLIENYLKQSDPLWQRSVWGLGVHQDKIEIITTHSPQMIDNCDGLMTAVKHTTLMMKCADCQIAFFYDFKKHIAAVIHAGWRGSVLNIYQRTVQQLQKTYGSQPEDLIVCISPSLGPQKAEFIHYKTEFPESFWKFQTQPNYFNFWEISRQQLLQAGILPEHIEIAKQCTYSQPQDFFSYRRDKITGRHAVCLTLL